MLMKLLGITNVDSEVTDQQLIKSSVCDTLEKKWKYNDTIQQLFIDFKKA
jgi:hypothetical protein